MLSTHTSCDVNYYVCLCCVGLTPAKIRLLCVPIIGILRVQIDLIIQRKPPCCIFSKYLQLYQMCTQTTHFHSQGVKKCCLGRKPVCHLQRHCQYILIAVNEIQFASYVPGLKKKCHALSETEFSFFDKPSTVRQVAYTFF